MNVENQLEDGHEICPYCYNACQIDVCWCGIGRENHNSWDCGHGFVPLGCTCGFCSES